MATNDHININKGITQALLFLLISAAAGYVPAAATAEAHFNRGMMLYERGEYAAAVDSFEQATEVDPRQSRYHHWLGKSYGRLAEQSGWLQAYTLAHRTRLALERAVELDENNRDAIKDLMAFYEEAPALVGGDPEKAETLRHLLARMDNQGGDAFTGMDDNDET